jgi:hypothetical protein
MLKLYPFITVSNSFLPTTTKGIPSQGIIGKESG